MYEFMDVFANQLEAHQKWKIQCYVFYLFSNTLNLHLLIFQ